MKNLSCAAAFLLSVLGSTNATKPLKVEIDCKHPDTDHETTKEDSVYAEFYGTTSDTPLSGGDQLSHWYTNPAEKTQWLLEGTSDCDVGIFKEWVSPKCESVFQTS